MNPFVIPGDISHLKTIAEHLTNDVSGILLHQRTAAGADELSRLGLGEMAGKIHAFDSLRAVSSEPVAPEDQSAYTRLLNNILGDPRVHYLATRSQLDSPFNNAVAIEKITMNSLRLIRKANPSCLVASSTPHSVEAWVFAKCFEFLRLPVYILESTPIAFRSWIYRGIDTQEVVLRRDDGAKWDLTESTRSLVKAQRESRPGAKDESGHHVSRIYLNSIKGSDTNRWWSTARECKWLCAGKPRSFPLRLRSVWRKLQLYRSYREVAIRNLPQQPFVIFFMHYQPERSSLPVGRFFSQQWMAIRALSWALPAGWKLLVREHPTTWFSPLDPFVRIKTIYADMASLTNTHVCSMDIDTFELIDQSSAVATLTGSVGFQSLLRGKPVLAFGLAAYKDHPACFSVSTFDDIVEALNAVKSGECAASFTEDALQTYLGWVERNSVCVDPDEPNWIQARLKNFAEIYRQLMQRELKLDHQALESHAQAIEVG
jgi:hypothetical protein